jgi:DNA-binding NarL/FixJ family response regulator
MTEVIRVGIIEDHLLLQRGLVELLNEVDDIAVVWTATTVPEMQSLLEAGAKPAALVILDRSLPGGGPQSAEAVVAVVKQGCRVLVLSRTESSTAIASAFAAGARAYLSKHAAEDEIVAAIYSVARGETYVSSDLQSVRDGPTPAQLTARELDIVRLLARGLSDAAIAIDLFISIRTVRTHLDRIEQKIGVRRRGMIVRWAIGNGLISADEDS